MNWFSLALLSAAVCFNLAYIVEHKETLNGHVYTIREDQPFFRVWHPPHTKVWPPKPRTPGANGTEPGEPEEDEEHSTKRKEPKFGHHHLPKGEKKDSANWPWAFRPYLPCMDLGCQCPAFKGKIVGDTCFLPSGKVLKKAVRKEFRTLTREERHKFMFHLHEMKRSGLYNEVGLVHRRSGVHAGPSFFPWHREFIKRLELVYRTFNPDQGLPYWDSTLDNNLPEPKDSVMFSKYLMGDTDEDNNAIYGPFHNWTTIDGRQTFKRELQTEVDGEFFNEARINFVLNQTEINRVLAYSLPLHTCLNYSMDDRFLEYSHDYVHYYISGDMQERFSSSNDPIFIMHHGFVDSIWEMWRQLRQTREQREYQYPDDNPACMPLWHFLFAPMPLLEPLRNIDALSNSYTDNLYEYAPRPTCKSRSEECQSEFLFCDTDSNPEEPRCSSKVKLGGNCSGFEWAKDACYEGHCVQGRCIARKEGDSADEEPVTKAPHSQKYM